MGPISDREARRARGSRGERAGPFAFTIGVTLIAQIDRRHSRLLGAPMTLGNILDDAPARAEPVPPRGRRRGSRQRAHSRTCSILLFLDGLHTLLATFIETARRTRFSCE